MRKRDRRRHFYLINKPLQFGFLALVLFVPDIVQMGDQGLSLDVRAAAADRFLVKRLWAWPAVIAFVGIIAFHSFRAFWRVVGPLYRFQVVFKQVRSGDLSCPVKIRAKDYLHPQAETFNDMLRVLAEKLERIKQSSEDAMKTLEELEKNMTGGAFAGNAYRVRVAAHRRYLKGLVTAGILGAGFQPGISRKEISW